MPLPESGFFSKLLPCIYPQLFVQVYSWQYFEQPAQRAGFCFNFIKHNLTFRIHYNYMPYCITKVCRH